MVEMKEVLVSIKCLVYNHEPYLRQCLDGFVMQKTNFVFEAIVHDDASTDSSAAIIREYAEKYPNIIKPIFETENQYSKKDGSLGRIMNAAIHPNAKYIALCEGDDYWIDPYKLQKQVDFLESNEDYGLSFTDCKVFHEDRAILEEPKRDCTDLPIDDCYFNLLLEKNVIPTLTVVVRKDLYLAACNFINGTIWDRMLWIFVAKKCRFKYMKCSTGVYRILRESASHSQNPKILLANWDRGTRDLLDMLYKMNLSEKQLRAFIAVRGKYLLFLSYQAKDSSKAEFYYNLLKQYNILRLVDKVNYYSTKYYFWDKIFSFVRFVGRKLR